MAIARENQLGNNSAGTGVSSLVITLAAGASVGSHVLVGVGWGASDRTTTVADSEGNTYQQDSSIVSGSNMGRLFSSKVASVLAASDTITITWTGGTVNVPAASAAAYTGVKATGWFREENSGAATSNNINSGDLTTVQSGDLLFGFASILNANAVTPGTDWTEVDEFTHNTTRKVHTQERVTVSSGTFASTATSTGAPVWIALAAAYEADAGGGGGGDGELVGAVPI